MTKYRRGFVRAPHRSVSTLYVRVVRLPVRESSVKQSFTTAFHLPLQSASSEFETSALCVHSMGRVSVYLVAYLKVPSPVLNIIFNNIRIVAFYKHVK